MARDQKFYMHLKAFLLSHLTGDDPKKNLAKIRAIANTNPDEWDGRLPTEGVNLETGACRVMESSKNRPVVPWQWYSKEHEPVPPVVGYL